MTNQFLLESYISQVIENEDLCEKIIYDIITNNTSLNEGVIDSIKNFIRGITNKEKVILLAMAITAYGGIKNIPFDTSSANKKEITQANKISKKIKSNSIGKINYIKSYFENFDNNQDIEEIAEESNMGGIAKLLGATLEDSLGDDDSPIGIYTNAKGEDVSIFTDEELDKYLDNYDFLESKLSSLKTSSGKSLFKLTSDEIIDELFDEDSEIHQFKKIWKEIDESGKAISNYQAELSDQMTKAIKDKDDEKYEEIKAEMNTIRKMYGKEKENRLNKRKAIVTVLSKARTAADDLDEEDRQDILDIIEDIKGW